MPVCVAFGCSNSSFSGCGKSFHRFPFKDPDRLSRWVENIHRKKWQPSRKSLICSDHFEEAHFDRTGQTVRLRDEAEPTIFPSFPKHLQRKLARQRKRNKKPPLVQAEQQPCTQTTSTSGSNAIHPLQEHSYNIDSLGNLKRKLATSIDTIISLQKKLKCTQQKSRRLQKRVESLKKVVKELKAKNVVK
ncbi:THAP domain-containing protein 2-like [Gouania willdenowi]|uniref:THAP domain-containing protein 2-like n=1 Tax=Gouania willdenowi TaxID=441366 RepID=A0A8C5I8I7_GOUWI|nr:THAP domain-containing protein 2-like [Gouania willdenowi]